MILGHRFFCYECRQNLDTQKVERPLRLGEFGRTGQSVNVGGVTLVHEFGSQIAEFVQVR